MAKVQSALYTIFLILFIPVMAVVADSHRIPYYLPKMDRTQRLLFN